MIDRWKDAHAGHNKEPWWCWLEWLDADDTAIESYTLIPFDCTLVKEATVDEQGKTCP